MSRKRAAGSGKEPRTPGGRRPRPLLWFVSAAVLLAAIGLYAGLQLAGTPSPSSARFTDVRAETARFFTYERTISLTPAQESIYREALSSLSAPCCSDRTALTCCCTCNMARSWWGLAKHLIADEGYDADGVQAAVEEWFAFINPDGFSGDACYTGGCNRPFRRNGCGGMKRAHLVL